MLRYNGPATEQRDQRVSRRRRRRNVNQTSLPHSLISLVPLMTPAPAPQAREEAGCTMILDTSVGCQRNIAEQTYWRLF